MKPSSAILLGTAAFVLAACSSSGSRNAAVRVIGPQSSVLFATGPIYSACQRGGRDQASRARCGCVQAVANQSLASGDQQRGAEFFTNPHQAQEVRQSDRPVDERFWRRWKDYSSRAAQLCS
jgi:hypothetical protein